MIQQTTTQFAGYTCLKLENEYLSLWVTQNVGPRIIGLALREGPNLLAQVPDKTVSRADGRLYSFRGGHRLWYAPENLHRTYLPDDVPVEITKIDGGCQVIQPVEAETGIQKSLTITLAPNAARVTVDHQLHNTGSSPLELAPWAITQLRPGGLAILPQNTTQADEQGLLPNRHLVLWPYTKINSPHLILGDRYIFIQASMTEGALKIGFPNPAGWLAYLVDNTVFVKRASYQTEAAYFDQGSSSECYCDFEFLELETLGPRTTLAPGERVSHCETWELYANITCSPIEAKVDNLPMLDG